MAGRDLPRLIPASKGMAMGSEAAAALQREGKARESSNAAPNIWVLFLNMRKRTLLTYKSIFFFFFGSQENS